MTNGQNFFDQPVHYKLSRYEKIWKIETGQGGDYKTGCLLDYVWLKIYCNILAKNLSKQQSLDADPKAI